ncbi:coiled-coil domain-containing protein 110 isoform X2 [Engystomops pustulosus]
MKDTLSESIKKMDSTHSTSLPFQMTSTPKSKDVGRFSHLRQFTDRSFIPFPNTDQISDSEKNDKEKCDKRRDNSTNKSSEVSSMAHKKYRSSDDEFSSVKKPSLTIKDDDEQPKSSKNSSTYHISQPKDSFVSFEIHDDQVFQDQTLSLSELMGNKSETEAVESGQLEISDISWRLSEGTLVDPVTNVSQLIAYDVHLTKEVPSLHESSVLLHTREARISDNSVDRSFSSYRNTSHLKHVISSNSCQEHTASEEKGLHLQKLDQRDISAIKGDGYVFRIQELESYLTESDQLYMQEKRLKSKAAGVHLALKHLRVHEQCLKDENLRCREQISRLKSEKNFLKLSLSKAEQDGEDSIHEISTITDKCEELLKQRKQLQDERSRLSVEKLFLLKDMEDLKREQKRSAEQLALITAEKEKLVKLLNSTKKLLFTHAKEKEELLSRYKEVLEENADLRRKINVKKIQEVKE